MKTKFLFSTLAVAIGLSAFVSTATAATNDSIVFSMVRSAGAAGCLSASARGRVTISNLGPVQNMHVEVASLPANVDFTLFVITTPNAPFVPAWYQGDITTNAQGKGVVDVTGILDDETFILNPGEWRRRQITLESGSRIRQTRSMLAVRVPLPLSMATTMQAFRS